MTRKERLRIAMASGRPARFRTKRFGVVEFTPEKRLFPDEYLGKVTIHGVTVDGALDDGGNLRFCSSDFYCLPRSLQLRYLHPHYDGAVRTLVHFLGGDGWRLRGVYYDPSAKKWRALPNPPTNMEYYNGRKIIALICRRCGEVVWSPNAFGNMRGEGDWGCLYDEFEEHWSSWHGQEEGGETDEENS